MRPGLNKQHLVFILPILLILALPLAVRWWPSPEKAVLARFEKVEGLFEKTEPEHPIRTASRANALGALATEPMRMDAPAWNVTREFTRQQLIQRIAAFRAECDSVNLNFDRLKVEFPRSGQAQVLGIMKMRGVVSGEPFAENHALLCDLVKTEEGWRYERVELIAQP